MNKVMMIGESGIQSFVTYLLDVSTKRMARTVDYHVFVIDQDFLHADAKHLLDKTPHIKQVQCDVKDKFLVINALKKIYPVISYLPFFAVLCILSFRTILGLNLS